MGGLPTNSISKLSGEIYLGSRSFHVINIKDMSLYAEYIKKNEYLANLWTSNFAFLWAVSQSSTRKILWKLVDDMLVTFTYLKGGILYLTCLPFGEGDSEKVAKVIYRCLKYCYKWNNNDNSGTAVKVINNAQLEFLRKFREFDKYFRLAVLSGLEKHFSIQKLVSLSGKEFETIRRKINKFHRLYPEAVIRDYKPDDYENVAQLDEYWIKTSRQKYSHIFDEVYFHEIVKHYDE